MRKQLYYLLLLLLFIRTSFPYPNLNDVLKMRKRFDRMVRDVEMEQKMRFFNPAESPRAVEDRIILAARRYEEAEDEDYALKDWKEYWNQKRFEAVNDTKFIGDAVDMVAARPWGVPCGDPNQYDVPWGTCTLPAECDGEFRIYRGDQACGRTQFVCCAILDTNYDLNQPIDQSFDDSGMSTDTEEMKKRQMTPEELRRKKLKRQRKQRQRLRKKRKLEIKRNIERTIYEIKRLLHKLYANKTRERKKKTEWMRKYIEELKKQLKHDRYSIKEIHSGELEKSHQKLLDTFQDIRDMNSQFVSNVTYKERILNPPTEPEVSLETLEGTQRRRYIDDGLQYDLYDFND